MGKCIYTRGNVYIIFQKEMCDFADFEDFPEEEFESLSQSQSQPAGSEFDPDMSDLASSNQSDSQVILWFRSSEVVITTVGE